MDKTIHAELKLHTADAILDITVYDDGSFDIESFVGNTRTCIVLEDHLARALIAFLRTAGG